MRSDLCKGVGFCPSDPSFTEATDMDRLAANCIEMVTRGHRTFYRLNLPKHVKLKALHESNLIRIRRIGKLPPYMWGKSQCDRAPDTYREVSNEPQQTGSPEVIRARDVPLRHGIFQSGPEIIKN